MKKTNNENECTAKKDDEPDFKKGAAQGLHRLLSACLKGSFEYRWFSLIAAFICWSIFLWVGIYEMLVGGGLFALGEGGSKAEAEKAAAKALLCKLQNSSGEN